MLSKALSHFPQFQFRDGKKRLWNPILKKTFANLPEERVRLKLINFLTLEAETSTARISFESPVKLVGDKSKSRTDIICYDRHFSPLLLVECKAPDIKLDEKAAIQVARYNQKVGAPLVLVSNGLLDFWFEIEEDTITPRKEIPSFFTPKNKVERSFTYWKERGFIGEAVQDSEKTFITALCSTMFGDPHQPVKFLNFEGFSEEFALDHYYRIFGITDNVKIGVSIAANNTGGTRLNVVLNEHGANIAFMTTCLDNMYGEQKLITEIHSAKGEINIDLLNETGFGTPKSINDLVQEFHRLLAEHS